MSPAENRSARDEEPAARELVIPAGTEILVTLDTPLASETNRAGDRFVATTVDPVAVEGRTILPAGAKVHGSLRDVQPSGCIKGRARMTLAFEELVDPAGKVHPLAARPITFQAKSGTRDDVEKIAGGGIVGALIGGITGGKKGAAVGTAVGAGAGAALVLATKGDEIELPAGRHLRVRLLEPRSLTVAARE